MALGLIVVVAGAAMPCIAGLPTETFQKNFSQIHTSGLG
jgi:hypothetical protein